MSATEQYNPTCQSPQRPPRLVRAPLVVPAVAMILGIVLARYIPVPAMAWLPLGASGVVLLIASLVYRHLHAIGLIGACMLAMAAGAFRTAETYHAIADNDIALYAPPGRMLATVRGEVASPPRRVQAEVEFGYRPEPKLMFDLRANAIRTGETWTPVSGLVSVIVDEPWADVRVGEGVELAGWLGGLNAPRNPGGYDAAASARLKGIRTRLTVPTASGVTPLPGGPDTSWLTRQLRAFRDDARSHFTELDATTNGQVTTALVVGERSPALRRLSRVMVRAGVAHLLSISGMHLAIFCGFIYLLARALTRSPRIAAGVVLLALAMYLLTAQPRAAMLRGGIMAGALAMSVLFRRQSSALNALAVAAIILLLADPLQLLQPGFQLSFVIVTALLVLTAPARQALFGRWVARRGLMVFREGDRWRRWVWYRVGEAVSLAITASVVAYLAAAPLVAVWFGLFSPWAILLSLLLLPLVVAVLVPGYVSLSLAWLLPGLAATLGTLANALAGLLAWVVERLTLLPGLSLTLQPMGTVWVGLCYATMLAVLFARRWRGRTWLAGGLAGVLAVTTAIAQWPAGAPDRAELHVLAVGAGQCALLRLPEGGSVLIDAGTRSGYEVYGGTLEPFLQHEGYSLPKVAIVSHPNADHYSALPGLARSGELRRVYVNEDFMRQATQPFDATARLWNLLDEQGVEVRPLAAGDVLPLDADTTATVLWPPAGRSDLTGNDASLVLRVTHAGRTVLLPGDIGEAAMAELLTTSRETLAADAVILPHHGSWENSLPAFIEAIGPQVVIVSGSREPRPPTGADETTRTFYTDLKRRYRYASTASDGWLALIFGHGRMDVQTYRQQD